LTNAIELHQVRKTFGPKVAVEGLDLVIPQGIVCGYIGPNGAGKTTSIRMIMSIIFPDSGRLEVLGKKSAIESKDRIGYLPEERGVYRKMKVGAFVEYMARLKGLDSAEAAKRAKHWLERVDLGENYRKKCEELSKGMQQKVQFIASVIHDPELLILDEPFSGLDPVNSRLLRDLIDEQHKRGCTIIFSTHQMYQAEALCDRIVMIHQGRKVIDATPRELADRFNPREVMVEPLTMPGAPSPNGDTLAALRSLPGVERVEALGRSFELTAREGVEASSLIPRVVEAMPVARVEVCRPSLEDIFIEIVEGAHVSHAERERLKESLRQEPAFAGSREKGGD
jgi:ABC-2 type transport system ATP-binding protein